MPGPAMHHLIAAKFRDQILNDEIKLFEDPQKQNAVKALLNNSGNLPYFYLGCQGPDFLFFHPKDWRLRNSPSLYYPAKVYFEVADNLHKFESKAKKLIPGTLRDTLERLENATDKIPVLQELRKMMDKLATTISAPTGILVEIAKILGLNTEIFNQFEHPYRDGVDGNTENWWLFDILHYRDTGKFVKALFARASHDLTSPLYLYALGYLTHYTADTVGHPYVNLFSGGPYRSHAQRHKTGENYQDAYNYRKVNQDTSTPLRGSGLLDDLTYSNLHAFYNFKFNGQIDTSDDNPDDHVPNPNSTVMPDKLGNLIFNSIKEVYYSNGIANVGQTLRNNKSILDAYRIYYTWLKNSTTLGNSFPKPEPYHLTEELQDIWNKAMDKLGSIGNDLKKRPNQKQSTGLVNIIKELSKIIWSGIMAAAAVAEVVAETIRDSAATVTREVIEGAINLIYEQLYNVFQNCRLVVTLNGFAFPMNEHLNHPLLTQFQNPSIPDLNQKTGKNMFQSGMPRKWNKPSGLLPNFLAHLLYPVTDQELPEVTKNPLRSYLDKEATHYAWGEIKIQPDNILDSLLEMQNDENNQDPEDIKRIFDQEATLGNAINLAEECHKRIIAGEDIPDFNLDADRGYGYLCWTHNGDSPYLPSKLEEDDNGHIPIKII